MRLILIAFLTFFSLTSMASEQCYQLSKDGISWSRTAEILCVHKPHDLREKALIELKMNSLGTETIIAQYHLTLARSIRCFNCNGDVFSVVNPSNSLFNDLAIRFEGYVRNGIESGKVNIGKSLFFYREYN